MKSNIMKYYSDVKMNELLLTKCSGTIWIIPSEPIMWHEGLNKEKMHIPFWARRFNKEKIQSFYLLIYHFSEKQTYILTGLFGNLKHWFQKSCRKTKKSPDIKREGGRERSGRTNLSDLKACDEVTVINSSWWIQKKAEMSAADEWVWK